jgi:hypothetical protein
MTERARSQKELHTPPAWMMMRTQTEILFFRWVTLTERKWVSFRERRSVLWKMATTERLRSIRERNIFGLERAITFKSRTRNLQTVRER